jgi:hypothetical protein
MITSTPSKNESSFQKTFFRSKIGGLYVNPVRQSFTGLIEIEAKYHEATQNLEKLRQTIIGPICAEAAKIGGKFWGIWETETIEDTAIFTYVPSIGFSSKWVNGNQTAKVEITADEDLPPLIEEITEQEAYQKLRERFEGKCSQIPLRQDLFNLYHIYEHKSKRYNIIRSCCMELLKRESDRIYYEKTKLDINRIIRLSFGSREYQFLKRCGKTECISEPSNPLIDIQYYNET